MLDLGYLKKKLNNNKYNLKKIYFNLHYILIRFVHNLDKIGLYIQLRLPKII